MDSIQIVFLLRWAILNGFNTLMRVLGPCLMVVVAGITIGELYVFFRVLLPVNAETGSLLWVVNACFAVFLALATSFNYWMCVFTNPGTHDSEVYERLQAEAHEAGALAQPSLSATGRLSPVKKPSSAGGRVRFARQQQPQQQRHPHLHRNQQHQQQQKPEKAGAAEKGPAEAAKATTCDGREGDASSERVDALLPDRWAEPAKKSIWLDQEPFEWGWCTHVRQR